MRILFLGDVVGRAGRAANQLSVAQVLGQVFMKRPFDDPFSAVRGFSATRAGVKSWLPKFWGRFS